MFLFFLFSLLFVFKNCDFFFIFNIFSFPFLCLTKYLLKYFWKIENEGVVDMIFGSLFVKELQEKWFLVDDSRNKVVVTYKRDMRCPRLIEGLWDHREIFNIFGLACNVRDSFSISFFQTFYIHLYFFYIWLFCCHFFFLFRYMGGYFFQIIILLITVH